MAAGGLFVLAVIAALFTEFDSPEDDGRINLPMLVRGTSELPSVALNRDFLK